MAKVLLQVVPGYWIFKNNHDANLVKFCSCRAFVLIARNIWIDENLSNYRLYIKFSTEIVDYELIETFIHF